MTIPLTSTFFKVAFIYEIRIPFPESTSKTVSHIQSTAKYILLLRTPYATFLVVRQNCLKVSILSSKKNEYSVDRWAWLESTSWWWICQIWIEKLGKKLRKKILLHTSISDVRLTKSNLWMKEDPLLGYLKKGVAVPYHQSTLCPDVHLRVSPFLKNPIFFLS